MGATVTTPETHILFSELVDAIVKPEGFDHFGPPTIDADAVVIGYYKPENFDQDMKRDGKVGVIHVVASAREIRKCSEDGSLSDLARARAKNAVKTYDNGFAAAQNA